MPGEITIRVDKDTLVAKLRENRESHRALFEKAWEGYCKLTRQDLEDKLARIKDGKPIDPFLRNQAPQDHTGDYDDVIEMMLMDLSSTTELTQSQFKQYVQDDWGWKKQWTTSNTEYLQA